MKKVFLLPVVFILGLSYCQAQFLKSPTKAVPDTFSNSLSKIILDFKHDFRKIQGSELTPQENMDVFRSKVTLPGALHCVIYRFRSGVDTTASWQAVMYEGEDYKEAAKVYKELYRKVKKSRIRWVDSGYVGFSGTMEEPTESLNFTMSTLHLDIIDRLYKQFYAEVEMVNSYEGWEVHLNLHRKKSDTEE